ncbi:MAG: HEAT repeat domain-containing protein [Crocosphaera sp.]|nr:HEAT repeat domain-containing protein [Crocosphaera sp.]
MEIDQIKANLKASDFQQRLKAITELKEYDANIAVPLLKSVIADPEFLVRSFVSMGLGKHLTADSFAALLIIIKFDRDPNVRAEAANSLSMFGELAAPHLRLVFIQDDNWLLRRSILAALMDLNSPEELFEVCVCGLKGDDMTVHEAALKGFSFLVGTSKEEAAKNQLLSRVEDSQSHIRNGVAKALSKFEGNEVRQALSQLKQDQDHRVVAAVLEQSLYYDL